MCKQRIGLDRYRKTDDKDCRCQKLAPLLGPQFQTRHGAIVKIHVQASVFESGTRCSSLCSIAFSALGYDMGYALPKKLCIPLEDCQRNESMTRNVAKCGKFVVPKLPQSLFAHSEGYIETSFANGFSGSIKYDSLVKSLLALSARTRQRVLSTTLEGKALSTTTGKKQKGYEFTLI